MMFAVKKETCLGCKSVITEKDQVVGANKPLCINCRGIFFTVHRFLSTQCVLITGKESEIYVNKLQDLNSLQHLYNQLWTECQRCQGSFHQDVICSNRDCPIFYKRKKTQMDVQSIQETLDRFAW